ncbi:SGNH/GDSL hydrolase family protein [Glycomyces buryatensis]|uniref:SGNH/GDSL hydrolase family protein n=1 Tax=Glycomyces buryatensis TaxID=2570927 RepID=UPI00145627F7|nr:SGNH/GDSL hydrolase family protein [Glycomyces buryatensis]
MFQRSVFPRDAKPRWALRALAAAGVVALAGAAAFGVASFSHQATADITAEEYVALGDSYVAGAGAGDYIDDDACRRSENAYPKLAAVELGEELRFDACSGAETIDVVENQLTHLDDSTAHVSIGVGGNDIGFSAIMSACSGTDDDACASAIESAEAATTDVLPASLDDLYTQVAAEAGNAMIVVVGYPHLFDGTTCDATVGITPEEQAALNDLADLLNATTAEVAEAHGFPFADPREAFADHAICSEDPWLLGHVTDEASFHPNAAGQAGYAEVVLDYPYE